MYCMINRKGYCVTDLFLGIPTVATEVPQKSTQLLALSSIMWKVMVVVHFKLILPEDQILSQLQWEKRDILLFNKQDFFQLFFTFPTFSELDKIAKIEPRLLPGQPGVQYYQLGGHSANWEQIYVLVYPGPLVSTLFPLSAIPLWQKLASTRRNQALRSLRVTRVDSDPDSYVDDDISTHLCNILVQDQVS